MKPCPVCSNPDVFEYMKGIYDSDTTLVLECSRCGLQFLHPMMTEQEEAEYYHDYYRSQSSRHFKEFTMQDLQDRALAHYEQYRDIYGSLLQGRRRLLEIGPGTGGFLRFARSHYPEIELTAVELSQSNREFLTQGSLGIEVYCSMQDLPQGSSFDCVVALGVFEHIKDNLSFLLQIREMLEPSDGRLAMNVPNKETPLVSLYGLDEFKKFTYMRQHYYTYTEGSVKVLADKAGYRVDGFRYLQAYSLDNHLSWLKNRRPMDFARYTSLLSKQTLDAYNNDLIRIKATDLMMILLRHGGVVTTKEAQG